MQSGCGLGNERLSMMEPDLKARLDCDCDCEISLTGALQDHRYLLLHILQGSEPLIRHASSSLNKKLYKNVSVLNAILYINQEKLSSGGVKSFVVYQTETEPNSSRRSAQQFRDSAIFDVTPSVRRT